MDEQGQTQPQSNRASSRPHRFREWAIHSRPAAPWRENSPIRAELFSIERLEQHARSLAAAQIVAGAAVRRRPLARRLTTNARFLHDAYHSLSAATLSRESLSPAAEWIVDNFHIVERQVREIRHDLPSSYYRRLPTLTTGPLAGYPRVLGLAWGYIAHTDSHFDPTVLCRFLNAYQEVQPLTIGELWAVPITLRVLLVENLRRHAETILHNRQSRLDARESAERLLRSTSERQENIDRVLGSLGSMRLAPPFVVEFAQRLRNQEILVAPILTWLDQALAAEGSTVDAMVQQEQQRQVTATVTVRNIITSMRLVNDIDWQELFERVSLVDAALRKAAQYADMDFPTRDLYRSNIEVLSRGATHSELEIARLVLAAAARTDTPRSTDEARFADPGYHLIGGGRARFEAELGYRPPIDVWPGRLTRALGVRGYVALGAALSAGILLLALLLLSQFGVAWIALSVLALLGAIPAIDSGVAIVNHLVTRGFRATLLPAMELAQGVPAELRTLVVVPMLLTTPEAVQEQVERLEVHFLTSPPGEVYFALLSDWTDADGPHADDDESLLKVAVVNIAELNSRHGKGAEGNRFMLLHRKRVWTPSERKWIGWERKRGKLCELNKLLRGRGADTTFIDVDGTPTNVPEHVRYIVTLDADTRLTRDSIRRLIGKMAHPLNAPRYDDALGRVVEGHAIMQPRITAAMPLAGEATLFLRVFSSLSGIDPYAAAASDVYQDLMGEGSYAGKGIYDIDAFEQALAGRVPPSCLLSHDLFEGVFARSALASDVEFVEAFPTRYDAAALRHHRWARGDWQLLPWIVGLGPAASRDAKSARTPALGRWKMLDNLRRTMSAPATAISLLAGLTLPLPAAFAWTSIMLVLLATSPLIPISDEIIRFSPNRSVRHQLRALGSDFGLALAQWSLSTVFIAHQAWLMLDAAFRTIVRLATRRHLLEWTPAAQARLGENPKLVQFFIFMLGALVFAVAAVTLAAAFGAALPIGFGLALLWSASPAIAFSVSRQTRRSRKPLSNDAVRALRLIARRTWRYFETFVTQAENMLPPDNFQESPHPTLAHRTSPTNIGLYLLSVVSAREFAWISVPQAVELLEATLSTMQRLERRQGHFYNWYDTRDLRPLEPRYISSVDSGNLAGHLITVANACQAWRDAPRSSTLSYTAALDALECARTEARALRAARRLPTLPWTQLEAQLDELQLMLAGDTADGPGACLSDLINLASDVADAVRAHAQHDKEDATEDLVYWTSATLGALNAQRQDMQCLDIGARITALGSAFRRLAFEMDFRFLLDRDRMLLSIGYRGADSALDPSCYDLLASEARLASFIAIAKGDAPAKHWFRLSHSVTPLARGVSLISWSGSMFEYLMPSLVMQEPTYSLLNLTNQEIVAQQIAYARAANKPWGISESAYAARDLELTYQYSSFGVPDLGLKRGLGGNFVVSPYATALAAMVAPEAAVCNFERLSDLGALGRFGYYEAIDFTPERMPHGIPFEIVRAFMAHHQGMTIAAIANVLLDGFLRSCFHNEPIVKAAELLLQERMPRDVRTLSHVVASESDMGVGAKIETSSSRRNVSPWTASPVTNLLSNGSYTVMLTAAGSGYSIWNDIAITRWREDPTCDDWGSFVFLRDIRSGECWSPSLQPIRAPSHVHEVWFEEDRAEFVCRAGELTTAMDVFVSEEDNAEVRRISITNRGTGAREVEVTSLMELALASSQSDLAHPAFSKLFVETEHLPRSGALLARRRRRAPEEKEYWAAHLVVAEGDTIGTREFETDRARFIGRGRDARAPIAVVSGSPLSGSTGAVLDPIFALRRRMRIAPGETARLHFWTMAAASRDEALDLIDKHNDIAAFDRAATQAWTQAQVQLHHLGLDRHAAALYQQLAAHLIFTASAMRPSSETIRGGAAAQTGLWSLGISGDLPILLTRISESEEIGVVKEALQAFEYLRTKRLAFDLVILNERATSYLHDLQSGLESLVHASQSRPQIGSFAPRGHIYVLRADLISNEARALLISTARVVLMGERGPLADQLTRRRDVAPTPTPNQEPSASTSELRLPAPVPGLEFFNGLGGFAEQGKEYVIALAPGQTTPAPWINVIANQTFGFHTSESGAGYAWSVNSRERQLTPWSNDPISDRAGQAFYVRDLDSGRIYCPTASPLREGTSTYVARHGWGYSRFVCRAPDLELELLEYVPVSDPVKISRLTIKNLSRTTRHFSATGYVEWVLGPSRTAAAFVATEIDKTTRALFAVNRWAPVFQDRVAFADFRGAQTSYTADRREFIGRNGSLSNPAALTASAPLSGRVGAGLDPCAALQTTIKLGPGETAECVFLLGDAENSAAAQSLIERYRTADLDAVLQEVHAHWSDVLGAIAVKTPDRSMDIMLNGWLLYQALACRIWARSAFYQASGAYGFRDQLQDTMTFAAIQPQLTRAHILKAAARQFPEGDVQHWWLPHTEQGVRTRISDDRVWLAFATAHYARVSGDAGVLDEIVPFLSGPQLAPDQSEAFFKPDVSGQTASLYEHCASALDASLATGAHGAPLMGGGDWNDAMNRVGAGGKGESVWLGWLLYSTLQAFADIGKSRGDKSRATRWRTSADALQIALNREAWDGDWYCRGWYDDGAPLGSSASDECRIDSIAQSWAVLSGAGDPQLVRRAMAAVERDLIRSQEGLALLFTPAFDQSSREPGYIKGYPPGIRENGGQYTHAALWSVMAFAALGEGDKAAALFWMLNPVNHTRTRTDVYRYKVEPYAVAADVYAAPLHAGRGGWTWYTGSAGLMHRAGIESILGLRFEGASFTLDPCIPKSWPGFEIRLRLLSAIYVIKVENPVGVSRGIAHIVVDGAPLPGRPPHIPIRDDGALHSVDVTLG